MLPAASVVHGALCSLLPLLLTALTCTPALVALQAGLLTVPSLAVNLHLRELILMGNPCAEWSGYRPYVVAKLPQLKKLVHANGLLSVVVI